MNINEYKNKRTEYEIEGTGIDVTIKTDMVWTDKTTKQESFRIPAGSRCHVDFSPKKYSSKLFITHGNEVKISNIQTAHTKMTGINKPPTINTLEKWSFDGIAKSVTGKKVEPDGYSYDGSPSWLLVVGVI
jgi:hypothetical protein